MAGRKGERLIKFGTGRVVIFLFSFFAEAGLFELLSSSARNQGTILTRRFEHHESRKRPADSGKVHFCFHFYFSGILLLAPAPTAHSDHQQCSQAAGEQRYRSRLRDHVTDYAIRVVVLDAVIVCVVKENAKEGAIPERVLVVATGRAHAVGAAGGRIKRTARAVADRRDIEPVVLA